MPVTYVDISDANDVGQRIDNFLMRTLKGVPRQHVYRVLRKGEVRVNGGRIQSSYRLQAGDRVRIPPVRTRAEMPISFSAEIAQLLKTAVIYEDDDYLGLDKPAGVAVHAGSSVTAGVVEILREALGLPRLELVHRLDRETSGCLALAKRRQALNVAQQAFRERRVKKIYELFVRGAWPAANQIVQLRLERYRTSWGEGRVRANPAGQSARTDFKRLAEAPHASRLQAALHTGRTHQIRVHAAASGHPIVGDDKYGSAADRGPHAPRLCLHARRLHIPLPGRTLKLEAAVPADMEEIWTQFVTPAD